MLINLRTSVSLVTMTALGLMTALSVITTPSRVAYAAPNPPPGSWPFYRYDMQRTNRVPPAVAKGAITQPAIKWTYPVGGASNAWVADITGPNGLPDGQPEVITWGSGRFNAYTNGATPLWVSDLIPAFVGVPFIGDIDGDSRVEILAFTRSSDKWQLFALAGSTGQILSVITDDRIGYPNLPIIADLNSDGKLEVFEIGGDGAQVALSLHSYLYGANSPQNITTISFVPFAINGVGDVAVGDVNNDGTKEAIYFHSSPRVTILDSNSLLTTTHDLMLSPTYRRVYRSVVTDLIPSSPGDEIFFLGYFPSVPSIIAVAQIGSAPTYPLTTTWLITLPTTAADPVAFVTRLSNANDAEIVLSFLDTTTQQWETRLYAAATGAVIATLSSTRVCHTRSYGNLDADPLDELLLCQDQPGGLVAQAYDWISSTNTLQPKWPQPRLVSSLVSVGDLPSSNSYVQSSDLNGDGANDVLAISPAQDTLVAYSGVDGTLLTAYNFPPASRCAVRYVGSVLGTGTQVVLACGNGFVYLLDSTLTPQWQIYSGRGQATAYVVDSNGDGKNEVVLADGQGNLQNLDPYTATLQAAPRLNWVLPMTHGRALPTFWHPLNLDGGLWEYPILDTATAPTYTFTLIAKHPNTGIESTLATYVITGLPNSVPALLGVAQLNGSGFDDLLVAETTENIARPLHALQLSSGNLVTMWVGAAPAAALALSPPAFYDLTGDGADDVAASAIFLGRVYNGLNGNLLGASPLGDSRGLPIIAQLDGDPNPEIAFVNGWGGEYSVHKFVSPTLTTVYSGVLANIQVGVGAVAEASPSQPGLDIIYAGGGVLGAMSGINGSIIYTRALGVAFNTGTCESSVNTPMSYPGHQLGILEALCPGAGRFATINDIIAADIDHDGRDELLVASENGYLYALNAENGSLLWGYNFYYPVRRVIAANIDDADSQLEILVSVTNGFLYALDQQSFAKPLSAWDGPSSVVNDDADVQVSQACYTGHWRATSDPWLGQPDGYRIALRDEGGALMTNGYLNVTHTVGALVMGATLCFGDSNPQRQLVSNLIPGRRYFLEVISYKGPYASAPTFSDGILVANYGSLEGSTKSVTPTVTTPSGTLTWQVVVRNSTQAATTAQVLDPIPMNTTYVTGSASTTFGSVSYNAGQNRIEWSSGGALAAGQVVTITFQTKVNSGFSGGLIQNTAQIVNLDSGLTTLRSAAASVGASNLSSAVKTVDKAQAFINDVLTYTIRLTNTGTLTASGTLVNDPIPAGTSYVVGSVSSVGGSGSAFYNNVTKRVTWSGTLAPGQTLELSFRVKVNVANAVLDNCARINDVQNGSFDRCARTVVGSGGPSLLNSFKTSDRAVYSTTDTIVYTVTLVNDGTQNTTVQMRDVVPAGVTVQSASVIPVAGSLQQIGNVVSWTGSIAPGGIIRVQINGLLNSSDGVLVNQAIVTDTTTSQAYTLTREVLVGTTPALNLQKFAEPPSVDVGETITYVLRLENTGNMPASSAVLTDPLPSGTSYVPGSAVASAGVVTYNVVQQRLDWSGPVYLTTPTFITWSVQVVAGAQVGFPIVNTARSHDGQSDVDEAVALTPVNVPAGKALIRAYVYQGATGATGMSGVQVSAAGLATATSNTDGNGYVGLLVDALVTPTNYAVFQVVPAGFVNLTPNPVGVAGVTSGGVYDVVFRNAAQAPSGSGWVRGVVFHDVNQDGIRNLFSEVGIAGVTVQASDGQVMQTLGDGSYFFLLPAGARTITQTNLAGWLSSTPDVVTVNVLSQGVHEVNFGDWLCSQGAPLCDPVPSGQVRVYGYVYRDADAALNLPDALKGADDIGLPLVEVSVNAGAITDTTDASGMYVMDVPVTSLPASVELPVPPAGTISLSPQAVGVDVPAGYTVRVDFAVISTTVCGSGYGIVNGFVYSDTAPTGQLIIGQDGPTLTEAAVTLGSETQYTNWMYAFVCVPAGSATVASTNPAGYTNTTPNSVNVTVNDGGITDVNFGKAFQSTPITLKYAYVPIVRKE